MKIPCPCLIFIFIVTVVSSFKLHAGSGKSARTTVRVALQQTPFSRFFVSRLFQKNHKNWRKKLNTAVNTLMLAVLWKIFSAKYCRLIFFLLISLVSLPNKARLFYSVFKDTISQKYQLSLSEYCRSFYSIEK